MVAIVYKGEQNFAFSCILDMKSLETLSIQAYSSTGTCQKAALNLHLEKTSVIKNLNWPDECAKRTSDNIILIHEKQ